MELGSRDIDGRLRAGRGGPVGLADVPLGATSIRSVAENRPEDAAGAAGLVVLDNARQARIPFTLNVRNSITPKISETYV